MQPRVAHTSHAINKRCYKQKNKERKGRSAGGAGDLRGFGKRPYFSKKYLCDPSLYTYRAFPCSLVPYVKAYPVHLPRHPCYPLLVRNWVVSSYVNTFFCFYSHRIFKCQTHSRCSTVWKKRYMTFSFWAGFTQNLTFPSCHAKPLWRNCCPQKWGGAFAYFFAQDRVLGQKCNCNRCRSTLDSILTLNLNQPTPHHLGALKFANCQLSATLNQRSNHCCQVLIILSNLGLPPEKGIFWEFPSKVEVSLHGPIETARENCFNQAETASWSSSSSP